MSGTSDRPVFVYGVVAAATTPRIGAGGVGNPPRPVRSVVHDDLAALVSDLEPGTVPGRRDDLDGHARVLAEAIEAGTVVPMRFGMVLESEDAVRERLLARHAARLHSLLRALDGFVQVTVKAFYLQDALLRQVVRSRPDIARLREALQGRDDASTHAARVRLGELVAEAIGAQRAADEREILDRLAPHAADVRAEPPAHPRMALHAQVLVARGRTGNLEAATDEIARMHSDRLRFRYVGPLAPFSFSEVALDAGDPAWA